MKLIRPLLCLTLVACGSEPLREPGPADAGPRDLGQGAGTDGGPDASADAGATDGGSEDADAGSVDPVELALASGDPLDLPAGADRSLLEHIRDEARAHGARELAFVDAIYQGEPVRYDPGRGSQFFEPSSLGTHLPLAVGSEEGLNLAVAAELPASRLAAYGTNLIARLERGELSEHEAPFLRLLGWLTQRAPDALGGPLRVRLALHDDTSANRTTAWFARALPSWEVERCTTPLTVGRCLGEADLVITAARETLDQATIVPALRAARDRGAPLLYVHQSSWNATPMNAPVLALFELEMQGPGGPGNYFEQDLASWDDPRAMVASASDASALVALAEGFLADDFGFEVSSCTDEDGCALLEGYRPFDRAAQHVRAVNRAWDTRGRHLFETEGHRLQKLLTLLGDVFRREVRFPMDRRTTPTPEFLRALFADHALLHRRLHNPVPSDLGNFGPTDFGQVELHEVQLSFLSKPRFRAAGVYVVPGQVVRVTRTDTHAELATTVFVNTLRPGATHEFEDGGYSRPKFAQSPKMPIAPGETVVFSSPIGGPLQIGFDALDVEASFTVSGVGRHPFWQSPADDEAFARALADPTWNWAEIVTPGFEVHSRRDKMLETLEDPRWSDLARLTAAIGVYVHDHPHGLAGFRGPGITPLAEVVSFAETHQLDFQHIDLVKHMNADQALCGYGCSGNPYDAYWAFSPVAHGDLHELGHGLEHGRFKFEGRELHAHTNFYSYYSKSRYADDTGDDPDCQNVRFRELFDTVVAAQGEADPFTTLRDDSSLFSWNPGVALFMQAMLAAQERGALEDGWMLLPRLHLLSRNFDAARGDDASWAARRQSLGFSTFDRAALDDLSANDWLLITLSHASGLDFRPWFQTYGLETGAAAQAQVQTFGHPALPGVFYAVASFCDDFSGPEVLISPTATWPQ